MADFCHRVSDEVGAPVVDGVSAATVFAESPVRPRLATGKPGEYATPPVKAMSGCQRGSS